MIADEEFDLSDSVILLDGCVSVDNHIADVKVENYDVVAMNTQYDTIQVVSGSFTENKIVQTTAGSGITITNEANVGQTIKISKVENGKPTEWEAVDFPVTDLSEYAKKTEIPSVPSNVSQLTNDSGFQTAQEVTAIVNQLLGVIENGTY
jgi:hypothetical protein